MVEQATKVVEHLLACLCSAGNPAAVASFSDSLAKVARVYPSTWSSATLEEFRKLNQASDQGRWIRLLSHISHLSVPVESEEIESISDMCITSVHSVDLNIRRASVSALVSIGRVHAKLVLTKLLLSLETHSVNFEIFEVLSLLCASKQDLDRILSLIKRLFLEEAELVLSQYLGAVCQTVAQVCFWSVRDCLANDSLDPIGNLLREQRVASGLLQPLLCEMWELVSPLCWSKNLLADAALYDVVRASVSLIAVLPDSACSSSAVHSIQTSLLRLAIHARTSHQLTCSIESIRILAIAGKMMEDEETVGAIVPILIDLGIGINPLSFLVKPVGPVQLAMQRLWQDMSSRGVTFLVNRIGHSHKLSLADRLVTLHYLEMGVQSRKRAGSLMDSLVSCLDHLCQVSLKNISAEAEPLIHYALLQLIKQVLGSSLTVPCWDYLLALCVLVDPSSAPSSLRSYWFSAPTPSEQLSGPSMAGVRTLARWLLLEEFSLSPSSPVLSQRLVECMQQFPRTGMASLVRAFVNTELVPLVNETRSGEVFAWAILSAQFNATTCEEEKLDSHLLQSLIRLLHSQLVGFEIPPIISNKPTALLLQSVLSVGPPRFVETVARTLLSRRVVCAASICLFQDCVDFLADSVGEEIFRATITACEKELAAMDVAPALGDCVGQFAHRRFPEFVRILNGLRNRRKAGVFGLLFSGGSQQVTDDVCVVIARFALGRSMEVCQHIPGEIAPILNSVYLDPCLETLKAPSPPPQLLRATLISVGRFFACSPPIGTLECNEFLTWLLPLCLSTDITIARSSLLAVASVAKAAPSVSLKNFDQTVQFAISVLVHGVVSFSTVDISMYADRIDAVASTLIAVFRHAPVWPGLSRLAQSTQLAGINGPLPILRLLVLEVFAKVSLAQCKSIEGNLRLCDCPEVRQTSSLHVCGSWLEAVLVVVPRVRDPVTCEVAVGVLVALTGQMPVALTSVFGLAQYFSPLLPSSLLPLFTLLCVRLSSDACHDSALFVLELLNLVLAQRGSAIPPAESSRITARMFAQAEKHGTVAMQLQECIHTLSSVHLNSTLSELIASAIQVESQAAAGLAKIVFSESQISVIQSIVKVRKMCIGFVNFMSDLMNNSEVGNSGGLVSRESLAAAAALAVGLSVPDSRVHAIVQKYAAVVLGTILIFPNPKDQLLQAFYSSFPSAPPDTNSIPAIIAWFKTMPHTAASELANFLIPFLARKLLAHQRLAATQALAELADMAEIRDALVPLLSDADLAVHALLGMAKLYRERREIFFNTNATVAAVANVLNISRNIALLTSTLGLLESVTRDLSKVDGSAELQTLMLGLGPSLTSLLTDRLDGDSKATCLAGLPPRSVSLSATPRRTRSRPSEEMGFC